MGLFSFESKQVKEWKKLAKSGDMEAQYHLARAYANGKGASINMKRAVDYCVQSAEQEYAPAQALLAHFYGYGKGVDKNYEEMIHWGEKAALQGYAQAQYNVGRCYEQGKGKEKDFEKAMKKDLETLTSAQIEKMQDLDNKNIDNNRKYRCISEMKVGEAIYLHEEELLESPFVLIKAENHETELGWGKAKAICNTATLVSLTTGKKRTAILYCNNGSMRKEALKSIQSQVDDEYNHEAVAWNEPHSRIPVVLKNVQYTHKHNDMYVMTDRKTNEEYEMVPQSWAVPILDKLEYNTIVTIIYYEGKWDFVSKKETVDIGKYKFNIR